MARKTKLTDEMMQEASECIAMGMSYTATAKALNISYETFANWMKWGSEGKAPYCLFYTKVNTAESDLLKTCLKQLKKAADIGDINTIKWILEKRYSEDFGKPTQLNVKSENINMNTDLPMTYEQTEAMRADILSKLTPKNTPF